MTPSAPHPTEDALFLVAQDLADAAETRAVLDHVRFCRPCADLASLLRRTRRRLAFGVAS